MRRLVLLNIIMFLLLSACSTAGKSAGSLGSRSLMVEEVALGHGESIPKIRIAIDPGHGGHDDGTKSLDPPPLKEKFLALSTSLMLYKHLERLGYQPFLTRNRDVFIPLNERVETAHREEANLFVSVHYNAAPARQAHGVEVFFYENDSNHARVRDSKALATKVLKGVIDNTEARDRGVKHGNFAVIRNTKIPAILVEGGFLSNTEEAKKIGSPGYQNRVAWGIALGIDDYLNPR